jgi:hypothetical protein
MKGIMAILAECAICDRKQSVHNKKCAGRWEIKRARNNQGLRD